MGLLLSISAADLRTRDAVKSPIRADLITRVNQQRAQLNTSTRNIASLQQQISAAQTRVGPVQQSEQSKSLGIVVGAQAVQGPGLTIKLDDKPGARVAGEAPAAVASAMPV